jgi:hypothetical protein
MLFDDEKTNDPAVSDEVGVSPEEEVEEEFDEEDEEDEAGLTDDDEE